MSTALSGLSGQCLTIGSLLWERRHYPIVGPVSFSFFHIQGHTLSSAPKRLLRDLISWLSLECLSRINNSHRTLRINTWKIKENTLAGSVTRNWPPGSHRCIHISLVKPQIHEDKKQRMSGLLGCTNVLESSLEPKNLKCLCYLCQCNKNIITLAWVAFLEVTRRKFADITTYTHRLFFLFSLYQEYVARCQTQQVPRSEDCTIIYTMRMKICCEKSFVTSGFWCPRDFSISKALISCEGVSQS